MSGNEYDFDNLGIGVVLESGNLKIPVNQRSYAWEKENVEEYFTDLASAIKEGDESYFFGTIVLVEANNDRTLIADGQQRLATTSIALARIRDILNSLGATEDANSINTSFLKKYDRKTKSEEFNLQMNSTDNEFFYNTVIQNDWIKNPPIHSEFKFTSNERLFVASEVALKRLRTRIDGYNTNLAIDTLNEWADFLEEKAQVVKVTVSDEVGAFRMFETLNDRGLRASQIDILKNYFFSKVKPNELSQVQSQWNEIYGIISEYFNSPDERMLKFLKHFWIMKNGLVKDRELANKIKSKITNGKKSIEFISDARNAVSDYVAIFNSNHDKWKDFPADTRKDLDVLSQIISVEQIVPLIFASANNFSKTELSKSLRLFVVWSVRLMVGNTGKAGRLDKQYADLAHNVGQKNATLARELRDALKNKVPSDPVFKRNFEQAKVSNPKLARYYLISLETHMHPNTGELVPAEDVLKVNWEHILPKNYTKALGVSYAEHADLLSRIGNQTVMKTKWNQDEGDAPFREKLPT